MLLLTVPYGLTMPDSCFICTTELLFLQPTGNEMGLRFKACGKSK